MSTPKTALSVVLLVVGYPVAVVVLVRWVPVVREQRWRWFLAHQAAVAAIVVGWALRGRGTTALINAAWFAIAAVWYFSRRPTGFAGGRTTGRRIIDGPRRLSRRRRP